MQVDYPTAEQGGLRAFCVLPYFFTSILQLFPDLKRRFAGISPQVIGVRYGLFHMYTYMCFTNT